MARLERRRRVTALDAATEAYIEQLLADAPPPPPEAVALFARTFGAQTTEAAASDADECSICGNDHSARCFDCGGTELRSHEAGCWCPCTGDALADTA
jgi:hypothetical protein